jgi:hypothetical protein
MCKQVKTARTLKLLVKPDASGPGLLALTVRGVRNVYWLREIVSAIGGRCWELRKFRETGAYHVRLSHEGHSCSCPAGCWGKPCKHIASLETLTAREMV